MAKLCNVTVEADCDVCYYTTVESPCDTPIEFETDLVAGAVYYLWLVDKFDNVYRHGIIIEAGGVIPVDVDEYPEGFFTNHSGVFRIFLTTTTSQSSRIDFEIGSTEYSCITFEIE